MKPTTRSFVVGANLAFIACHFGSYHDMWQLAWSFVVSVLLYDTAVSEWARFKEWRRKRNDSAKDPAEDGTT